ncbi:sulfite exporter TauE/SafE family protein [Aneurinibacillus sp. REN35]|uniref:sulfite exporter TauE/SafE family protein n=1 Tax=Aneurinibacillus sp. REN35 TaxID=3237286 RepID=UPI0035279A01
MEIESIVVLLIIGGIGAFLSGLLGIGGAIVSYPLLLFVPSALGVAEYSAYEVSAMVAIQVFFSCLSGVLALRKDNVIDYTLVGYMGVAIVIGSLAGAYGGTFLSERAINALYAILATLAAILMFIPRKEHEKTVEKAYTFHKGIASVTALLVGIGSGIVGAGGSFVLLPIMISLLKIPTRVAIASSLAVTFISSIGTSIGKLAAGHVLLWPTIILVLGSIAAAPLGTRLGKVMNTKALRGVLTGLIILIAAKIWFDIFGILS